MNHSQSNKAEGEERAMIQYWLGELSPEAERRLEDRYFADDDLFEQLLAVREELFDAYARGELSDAERARFEQRLLQSPEDHEELEFSHKFVGALDREIAEEAAALEPAESPTTSGWRRFPRLVWAIVCAALLIGAGWLVFHQFRSHDRLTRLPSDQPPQPALTPSPDPSPPPSIALRKNESPPAGTLIVTLPLLNRRSVGGQTIQLKPETHTLRFHLLLDASNDFPSYRLALTQNRSEIRSWRELRPSRNGGAELTVDLHVAPLPAGEYSFELRGVNNDGTVKNAGRYSFRLVKP